MRTAALSLPLFLLAASAHGQSLTVVPASPLVGSPMLRPGYGAPQGSYQAFDTAGDLAAQANGAAAATASSTLGGFPGIHSAAYLNDGQYGNGASWVSDAANSFVTLDLGAPRIFGGVKVGRDRLGNYDDRDPGPFTIATSLTGTTYTTVFDSSSVGFSGSIDGAQTLFATPALPQTARYVRLTFANAGAAIDEIEVQAVPEPAPLAALGVGALATFRRRRR